MDLKAKVVIIYLIIAFIVLIFIGGVLSTSLKEQNLNRISEQKIIELGHIDLALTTLVSDAQYDIHELSLNEIVRIRDDSGFTTYLNASEETFIYSPGDRELDIIQILNNYQSSHPHVNSVYMGRENGTFVRSNERARNTAYDPRIRPWYILAKENPGRVMITDPYRSVTTPDVNLGIVTALTDQENSLYGVIGADITLNNLTSYISSIHTWPGGEMILVDKNGIILANGDPSRLFTSVGDILGEQKEIFLNSAEGVLVIDESYLIYYTSPKLGWKIGEIVSSRSINQKINESILEVLLFVLIALALLSVLSIIVLNHTIIRPLSRLTQVCRNIAETGDLNQKIDTTTTGEIGILARSFEAMVDTISDEEFKRKESEKEGALLMEKIEENMCDMATLNDEIRNPLTVILACAEMSEESKTREKIIKCVEEIDAIINTLDRGWLQSEKVWKFLNRHYRLRNSDKPRHNDEDLETEPDEESQ